MVCQRIAFHENNGNDGNHGNHGNDENHGNPGCKPQAPSKNGFRNTRRIHQQRLDSQRSFPTEFSLTASTVINTPHKNDSPASSLDGWWKPHPERIMQSEIDFGGGILRGLQRGVLGNSRNRTRSVLGQRHVSFPSPWGSQEKFV